MPHSFKMPHSRLTGWQALENQIEALKSLCQEPLVDSVSLTSCLSLLESVSQQLQAQMTQRSDILPATTQRHITEMHRCVRLGLTDIALCQGARSVALRQQRLEQLRDRVALLHQHAIAIVTILSEAA
jgi:hypothetical protein